MAAEISITTKSLPIRTLYFRLAAHTAGWLQPWPAPALRGLILRPLREEACQAMGGKVTKDAPAPDRGLSIRRQGLHRNQQAIEEDSRYCAGCIKNDSCPYGRIFEPDLRIINPALIRRQDDQGVRGVSIATDIVQPDSQGFGQPLWCAPGTEFTVRLLPVGGQAIEVLPYVVAIMERLGQTHGLGYQAPVKFLVNHASFREINDRITTDSLAMSLAAGRVPAVTLQLESPLLLKNCLERGHLRAPSFHELLSNSVRIVSRAVREYVDPEFLMSEHFGAFLEPAQRVQARCDDLIPFWQSSISHRGGGGKTPRVSVPAADSPATSAEVLPRAILAVPRGQADLRSPGLPAKEQTSSPVGRQVPPVSANYTERNLRGWLGCLTFADVPAAYLPWLIYAGQLGVGSDRNRGAGLWRVELG